MAVVKDFKNLIDFLNGKNILAEYTQAVLDHPLQDTLSDYSNLPKTSLISGAIDWETFSLD